MPIRLGIGDCVLVRTSLSEDDDNEIKNDTSSCSNTIKQAIGLIKYIGYIHGQKYAMKQYVGIELIEPINNGHDGNINGFQYFTSRTGCGIHVSLTSIICKLSSSEILLKLKDVLTFFKTKLSQYMKALHGRDEYIEKLKLKIKTNCSKSNINYNNINTSYPKLKITNDSSNTSSSKYSSFKLHQTTANIVINKLLTETRKKNYHPSSTHKSSHVLTPITPMTPLDTQCSFKSIDSIILRNMNINNTNPTNTPTTNTANTTPNIMKDNNSNSYPSTTRTSGTNTNTNTNTGTTSTYTNNTINSNRAVLPIINEPNNLLKNNMNKSRKILEFDNNVSEVSESNDINAMHTQQSHTHTHTHRQRQMNTPSSIDDVNKSPNTYYSDDDDDDESTTYYSSHKSLSYSNVILDITDDDTAKNNNINISNPNSNNNNNGIQFIKYGNYPYINDQMYNINSEHQSSFKGGVPVFGLSRSFHYNHPNNNNNNNNNSQSNNMLHTHPQSLIRLHNTKSAEYIPHTHTHTHTQPQNMHYQYGHTHTVHNIHSNHGSYHHNNHTTHSNIWQPDTPSLSEPTPNANTPPNHNTHTNAYTQNMYQPVLKYYANSQQAYVDNNNNQNNNKNMNENKNINNNKKEKHVKFHKSSIKKRKKKSSVKSKKHKQNKYSHSQSESIGSTIWTESTYENNSNNNNNNDELIDTLENQGFVISAQYMYDDNSL